MYKSMIFTLVVVAIFSFTCNQQNPSDPGKTTRVTFDITYLDNGSPGLSMPVHDSRLSRPAGLPVGQLQKGLVIPQSIDRVKVVFYTLDVDYQTINQNYEKNMDAIWEYINHLQGDKSDFEGYWMKQDRGELDFVASAQYRVESTGELDIKNNTAHGEFELTEGLKACRLGLWENGKLTHVGRASMIDGSGYFNVTAGETNHIQIYLIPITYFSNTAPVAYFTVSPETGTTATVFTFDASGSYDSQDPSSSLQVQWDWENDGTYDTVYSTEKVTTYQFPVAGTYTIAMEVMDSGYLTGETTRQVTVTESGAVTGTMTDIDGNTYQTIKIGDQW
jgi:hypothetical protein